MNVRAAVSEDFDSIFPLLESSNILVPLSKEILKSLIGKKGVYLEVFEDEDKKITATILGFEKSIMESNKDLKNNPYLKHLLKEIIYDFTYFHGIGAIDDPKSINYKKMMMMSYLDAVKKKTVVTLITDGTDDFIIHQMKYYNFLKENVFEVDGKQLTMYELDN